MNFKITTKLIFLCFSLVVFSTLTLGAYTLYQSAQFTLENKINKKKEKLEIISLYVKSRINEVRNDVLFLASTPPIKGYVRSYENNGIDLKDNSTVKQWKERLSIIFKEMMGAKSNYTQIRLIGIADNGKELIRFNRIDDKIAAVAEKDLISKGHRSYYQNTFKVKDKQVYFSEFSLNIDNNKFTYPLQVLLRASVPIYDEQGKPFGIIIINLDYNDIFDSIISANSKGSNYFATDSIGNILKHTEKNFNIIINESRLRTIDEYIPELRSIYKNNEDIIIDEDFLDSDKIVVSSKVRYNPLDPNQFIALFSVLEKKELLKEISLNLKEDIFILLLMIFITILISYFFSRYLTDPLKKLTLFAEKINEKHTGSFKIEKSTRKDEIGILTNKLISMKKVIDSKNAILLSQQEALDHSAIVAETDLTGKIIYVNNKFCEISQYSRDELIGQDHRIINSHYHPKEFFEELWSTISRNKMWTGEIKNRAKDGSFYWVDTSIKPIFDIDGKPVKYIAIRFDITNQKNTSEKLVKAKEKIQRALESKSSFLANMSHEIRTPLNGIIGFTGLLSDIKLPKEASEKVEHIQKCSESLLMIVNDILDYSKIEAGMLNIESTATDIRKELQTAIYIFDTHITSKNIRLSFEVDENIPEYILSDPYRLRQIFLNLIGNAIKFTDEGFVNIFIGINKKIPDQKIELICKVKDTGVGIDREASSKLFNAFMQEDSSTTREYGGTGLGLAICARLVGLMNGRIWVESEKHEGSEFCFTFLTEAVSGDLEVVNLKPKTINLNSKTKDLKILVAEDNSVNQIIAKGFLKKLGCENVFMVENGKLAVEAVMEVEYDLILMDIQMPEMDGYEATKVICKYYEGKKLPYIVGLSANVFPEDKIKALDAGMQGYLGKPLDLNELAEIINYVVSQKKK